MTQTRFRKFLAGAASMWPWPIAVQTPPPDPSLEAMKRAEAYVDPSRLMTAQMFVPYNPSVLVTRKGLAVFDQMSLDEQVKAALAFKVQAAMAGGWEVVSPGDQDEKWEVTTFVRDAFDHFPGGWHDAIKKMLRALRYGYSVCEKVYAEPERGPLKGKLVLDRLVEVKPHYIDFVTDKSGKVEAIKQMPIVAQGSEGLYPPAKFVHYVYDREFENAYGKSDLEAAYRPWWVKDNAYKWLAIVLERYGIPPLFAMYDPNQYQDANLDQLIKVVKNIQAATMGIIPRASKEGLEFWSQNLAAGSHELFIASLARFDADIAKALLQPSLIGFAQESGSQGAQSGGSLARSNTSWKSFMMVISDLQNDLASAAINSQIIPQLCDLNFSNLKSYPVFRFARPDDEKELELFTLWQGLVTGKIVNRIEDDERHIRKSLGMPENDSPVLEDLPGDASLKAKAEAEAAAGKKGLGPDGKPVKAKPNKVPDAELTEEMRAFAEENDAAWVYLDNHPVCFPADVVDEFSGWDESQHPRQPEGTDKGGEFAPADAAAFEAVHAAFQPAKQRIAKDYEARVTNLFEKIKADHGETLKGVGNSWTWARTYNSTVRENLKTEVIDASKSPHILGNQRYKIDDDKLRTNGIRFADASVREGAHKVLAKLGKVEGISASIHSDSNNFHVSAMKSGRRISIDQQMIINVSKQGTVFNQWPARIYVDGKSVSEAKYKKGEY